MSARIRNPFTPSFGQIPLYMAGRDLVIDEIMRAFENGVGDPNLSTILIGARGSGKTALMSLLAHEAQGFGGFRSMFLHFRVCLRTLPSRRKPLLPA